MYGIVVVTNKAARLAPADGKHKSQWNKIRKPMQSCSMENDDDLCDNDTEPHLVEQALHIIIATKR